MNYKKYFKGLLISVVIFLLSAAFSFAQNLSINLVAVNGTDEAKKTPVKYYLPKELRPEDIISVGDLKVDYDLEKGAYFVHGDFDLAPKESRTFKLQIGDVWTIDPAGIEVVKQQIDKNLEELEGTEFHESATTLRNSMFKRMDYILERQQEFQNNIERRIEEYRANIDTLEEIKRDAFSTDYLTSYPLQPELETDTVKMVIEVENPSKEEAKVISYKHYLPQEIRSSHLVDGQGFEVRFDGDRGQAYLTKKEEFQPGEKKRYIIVLKNAWNIPNPVINSFYARAKASLDTLLSTDENEELKKTANFLAANIFVNLKLIQESQAKEASVREHIGLFRINKERYEKADEALKQLERLVALVSSKKLEELKDLDKSKVKNVLKQIQALRGVAALSQAILGKRPSSTTTWRIIWGVLAFIALFTSIHFFTWRQRSKYMGEEHSAETGGEFKEIGEEEEGEEKEEGSG